MIKKCSRPEKTIVTQVRAIKGVDGKFRAFVCRAGPEEDWIWNLEGCCSGMVGVGREVAEVKRDLGGPVLSFVFRKWRGELEEDRGAPR